jgi:hypothetical protein
VIFFSEAKVQKITIRELENVRIRKCYKQNKACGNKNDVKLCD